VPSRRDSSTVSAVRGALQNLREEIAGGLLNRSSGASTSDVLGDLLQLARLALAGATKARKNVAAVLAAVGLRGYDRRIAKEHAGAIGRDKLESCYRQTERRRLYWLRPS